MRYHQAMLVSCEVPWDERERFLEETFRAEVRHFLSRGCRDLYIFGTAGEGYAVTTDVFCQVTAAFWEETRADDVHPQVGVIGLSTAAVCERISIAHRLGFRTFQISLPCWGALSDAELHRFFRDVCGTFPDACFLHYNLARTKRVLTSRDYRRLVDVVPNLTATKNTGVTPLEAMALVRDVPEVQHFFGETLFPTGCLHGTCSLLSSFAPLFPSRSRQLFEYGRTRQFDRLFPYQAEYLAAVEAIIAPLRRHALMDGAYDKALVRLGGFDMPLRLLSPYETFSEGTFAECRAVLHAKYADWLG